MNATLRCHVFRWKHGFRGIVRDTFAQETVWSCEAARWKEADRMVHAEWRRLVKEERERKIVDTLSRYGRIDARHGA